MAPFKFRYPHARVCIEAFENLFPTDPENAVKELIRLIQTYRKRKTETHRGDKAATSNAVMWSNILSDVRAYLKSLDKYRSATYPDRLSAFAESLKGEIEKQAVHRLMEGDLKEQENKWRTMKFDRDEDTERFKAECCPFDDWYKQLYIPGNFEKRNEIAEASKRYKAENPCTVNIVDAAKTVTQAQTRLRNVYHSNKTKDPVQVTNDLKLVTGLRHNEILELAEILDPPASEEVSEYVCDVRNISKKQNLQMSASDYAQGNREDVCHRKPLLAERSHVQTALRVLREAMKTEPKHSNDVFIQKAANMGWPVTKHDEIRGLYGHLCYLYRRKIGFERNVSLEAFFPKALGHDSQSSSITYKTVTITFPFIDEFLDELIEF